ncbi:MAG: putative endonuclease [Marivirga sp.]|jgi:putative endonuclease
MQIHEYYVYILCSKQNTALYVGLTNDIERRVLEHKIKYYKSHSARYNIDKLVFFEEYAQADKARKRELQLKNWKRRWKIELVEKENLNWNDLSEGWYDAEDLKLYKVE